MDYAPQPKAYRNAKQGRFGRRHRPSFLSKHFFTRFPFATFFHWHYLFATLLLVLVFFLVGRYWWREMRWRYIVIHHTAADFGSLAFYRRIHEKRWGDLAYHIVINNGSDNTAAGQIEYSQRWLKRQSNYSTKKDYLNYFGIAIVLVGDFEKHSLPPIQKQILVRLLLNLSKKYDIPPSRIIGHREVQNTKCPGKYINMVHLRVLVTDRLKNEHGANLK